MNTGFSDSIKEIISLSREEAVRLGNDAIDSGHLLLALIREGNNDALRLLQTGFNLDLSSLKKEIENAIDEKTGPEDRHPLKASASASVPAKLFSLENFLHSSKTPLTIQAENIIRHMVGEAKSMHNETVQPEHLLLSMLTNGDSIAAKILQQFGVSYEKAGSKLRNPYLAN